MKSQRTQTQAANDHVNRVQAMIAGDKKDAAIMSECSRFIAEYGRERIQFARSWFGIRR